MLARAMRMPEHVRALEKATVVVIGDIVADEYVYGETDRVSREAPVLIVRYESAETKLGGAANAAANIASLGARVRPVGIVGADAAGREVSRQFKAAGADTKGLVVARGRCTETKTRILAGGRSTTRQQMLRVDRAEDRALTPRLRDQLRERLVAACRGADAVLVSDYGAGLFDDSLRAELRELSRRIPVCVDSRYAIREFRGVTVVKPNEPELESAIGSRLRDEADVERAGREMLRALEVQALLVTRGRLGMSLFEPSKSTVNVPVWGPDEAVDVTGAGDTVLATLTSALAVGASFEQAARLANVAGGLVVQKPGTATITREELTAALEAEARASGSRTTQAPRAARRGGAKR